MLRQVLHDRGQQRLVRFLERFNKAGFIRRFISPVRDGFNQCFIPIPQRADAGRLNVSIQTDVFVPSKLSKNSSDNRRLGIMLVQARALKLGTDQPEGALSVKAAPLGIFKSSIALSVLNDGESAWVDPSGSCPLSLSAAFVNAEGAPVHSLSYDIPYSLLSGEAAWLWLDSDFLGLSELPQGRYTLLLSITDVTGEMRPVELSVPVELIGGKMLMR